MALDSDVYWKSVTGTTDYGFTPTFQNAGETTLPPELILCNTVLHSGYTSAQGDAMWGQSMGFTNRQWSSNYQRHEDNANYSDCYRSKLCAYPYAAVRSAANQEMTRVNGWGYLNDGRSIYMDVVLQTNNHHTCYTSLRFNPMPWQLLSVSTPAATDADWKVDFGFAPDWVWMFTSQHLGADSEHSGNWSRTHAYYGESFAHRDGDVENWNYWSEDNQNTCDNGTAYYNDGTFFQPWWNGAAYAESFDSITWYDSGIELDFQTSYTTQRSLNILAGKNANSKVGRFKLASSDYGDGVYRASDSTIKVTTGFKPKMVFFLGGRIGSENGHTTSVQNGRGFASENDQWAQSMSLRDNMTYTDVFRSNANDMCFRRLNYSAASVYDECSLNAMESDGFRVNLDNAGSYPVSYLALGDPPAELVLPYQQSIVSV